MKMRKGGKPEQPKTTNSGIDEMEKTESDQNLSKMHFKRKWAFDDDKTTAISSEVEKPIGFIRGDFHSKVDDSNVKRIEMDDKIKQSAMATARSPFQKIIMTGIMMFMTGNTLQIFSIMMLGMALWTPISGIMNTNSVFERFADRGVDLVMPKLTYIALNIAGFLLVCWKLNSMGLLPNHTWDWEPEATLKPAIEHVAGQIVS